MTKQQEQQEKHLNQIGETLKLPNENTFSIELLQVINDWQAKGECDYKSILAENIKIYSVNIPNKFKTLNRVCYRKINIKSKHLNKLGLEHELSENISSWTFDKNEAMAFKGGVPLKYNGELGVIFKFEPKNEFKVILNLDELFSDDKFVEACEIHKNSIRNYNYGIGRFKNKEKEIILEVSKLKIEELWAFGGHSSSIKNIAKQYYEVEHPTFEQVEQLESYLSLGGGKVGARWINRDSNNAAVERIISKNIEFVHLLRKATNASQF